jgi:hypothetical protein
VRALPSRASRSRLARSRDRSAIGYAPRVLVLVQHLLQRGRYDRERLAELGRLWARFEAQPGRLLADPMARAMAERISHLKRALSEATGEVRSCAGCAKGCVVPSGYFDGGRCCGTATLDVFTQPEVRAMKLAGLSPPSEPAHDGAYRAGCIFRGSQGCSLAAEARPARCLHYVCHELRIELEDTDRYAKIQALRGELMDTLARFDEPTR